MKVWFDSTGEQRKERGIQMQGARGVSWSLKEICLTKASPASYNG